MFRSKTGAFVFMVSVTSKMGIPTYEVKTLKFLFSVLPVVSVCSEVCAVTASRVCLQWSLCRDSQSHSFTHPLTLSLTHSLTHSLELRPLNALALSNIYSSLYHHPGSFLGMPVLNLSPGRPLKTFINILSSSILLTSPTNVVFCL
jgi:hypothetical protein